MKFFDSSNKLHTAKTLDSRHTNTVILTSKLSKMYLCLVLVILFINIPSHNSINEVEIASARPWCWTKPALGDPSFILNESNGGINWGFCKLGTISTMKKKDFYVYIATSQLPKSSTM